MRKRFRTFGTNNNVIGPVVTENLIKKEFKSVARNIDTTVTKARLDTVMKILFKLIRAELGGKFVSILFKKLYLTEIMILGLWRIASKFHFEDHLLQMGGKNSGVLRHKKSSFQI